MTSSGLDRRLHSYAQLAVNVGLNLRAGQRLLIIGPLASGGVSLEAAPLVRHIAARAYEAGASLVETIWGDDAIQMARFKHAPRTSFGEFSRWWGMRRRLKLQICRSETGLEIHAEGELGRYPWAVEIWRGNHLATLPLKSNELVVPDAGLVYLQSPERNPAGCAASGEGIRNLIALQEGDSSHDPSLTRSVFRRKGSPK